MRAVEKRAALQTILGSQSSAEALRTQLQNVRGAIGDNKADTVDALLLKLSDVLDDSLRRVATTDVTPEPSSAKGADQ